MTRRTRFGWRIGVILVAGFTALGSVPIALFFVVQGAERVAGLPNPAQVEAILRLVEQVHEPRPVRAVQRHDLGVGDGRQASHQAGPARLPLWPPVSLAKGRGGVVAEWSKALPC